MKYIIALIALALTTTTIAQVKIYNTSIIKPAANHAYAFYTNELILKGITLNGTTEVYAGIEKLTRLDSVFIYNPGKVGVDTIKVLQNGKQVANFAFQVEKLGSPKIVFGEGYTRSITLDYLLLNPGLQLTYLPQLAIPNLYVSGSSLLVQRNGKKVYETMIYGNAFSEKQINKLAKLQSGDVLTFGLSNLSDFMNTTSLINANLVLTIE